MQMMNWCCKGLYCIYSVSKKVAPPPKTFCDIFSHDKPVWFKIILLLRKHYIFLHLHRFWSIYLNSYMNCVTFTDETAQILTIYFSLLQNSWIFRKTSQIKWHLIKYSS